MNSKQEPIKTFAIETGVSPDFLEASLTQDITTLEALFDLIDNSIDAARDVLLKQNATVGKDKLIESYLGFKIHIRIDENSVRVLDNCSGIDESTLAKRALYTASQSHHDYGIGHFGIGLKRSLLKMGTHFALSADNGKSLCKVRFTNKNIGGNLAHGVLGYEYPSRNYSRSLFSVSNLKPEIRNDLHDTRWFKNAEEQLAYRYGIHLSKGFEIVLHNVVTHQRRKITGIAPKLRSDSKFPPQRKQITIDGVDIIIESGIHSEYVFPNEAGHSLAHNRLLTKFYGIYFSCNDRVIVSAATDREYGWSAKWHSEYNGYVCWVKFISKDPSKLPWNTSKTAIRTDSSLFLTVRDELQPIADHYRSEIKKRYSKPRRKPSHPKLPEPLPPLQSPDDSSDDVPSNPKPKPNPIPPSPINTSLIQKSDQIENKLNQLKTSKLASLYSSLCKINLDDHPVLAYVGAWAFIECLCSFASYTADKKYTGDFLSFFNAKLKTLRIEKNRHPSIRRPLREISELGNITKHDPTHYHVIGRQLHADFQTLDLIINLLLDEMLRQTREKTSNTPEQNES